jgi:hypothetical protein
LRPFIGVDHGFRKRGGELLRALTRMRAHIQDRAYAHALNPLVAVLRFGTESVLFISGNAIDLISPASENRLTALMSTLLAAHQKSHCERITLSHRVLFAYYCSICGRQQWAL